MKQMRIPKDKLEALWLTNTSIEIAKLYGLTVNTVNYYARYYGLPPRPRKEGFGVDPTPEEIAERAARVRESWTPEEEARRWVGPRRSEPWTAPQISLTRI